jgi:DNA-binding NarL/FixJ family response regulator
MDNRLEKLTLREVEVYQKLILGLLYKEIADVLDININTVKKHVKNIYQKLHIRNRTEATVFINKTAT